VLANAVVAPIAEERAAESAAADRDADPAAQGAGA
jgi:hypothetical protein